MGRVGVDYIMKMHYMKLIKENTHIILQGKL